MNGLPKKGTIFEQTAIAASQSLKEREYWVNKLGGELMISNFPCDKISTTRDVRSERRIEQETFAFSGELFSRLAGISSGDDPTLHMLLVAGVVLLLGKYTGSKDIVVATSIDKQETEGEFVNTVLPLRIQPVDNITFKELLLQTGNVVNEAIEHQNYPIDVLMYDDLGLSGEDEVSLFDVAVLLENIQDKDYIKHIPFSVVFSFYRTDRHIRGVIEYNSERYYKTTIEQMINHFNVLLRTALFHVDLKLPEISMLTAEEKRQLLVDFNAAAEGGSIEGPLHRLFEERVDRAPRRPAVKYMDREFTYGELNAAANRLARVLKRCGVGRDQMVGILLDRSPRMVESMMALWKAGGAYIPLDTQYPPQRINDILKDSGSCALITLSKHVNIDKDQFSGTVVKLDEESSNIAAENPGNLNEAMDINRLAYVIYTSGSTGKPKGVMVEQIGMMNHVWAKIEDLRMTENSIAAQNASHTFDISVWQFFAALVLGGKTVIYPGAVVLDPEQFITRVKKDKITILEVVPSYLSILLGALDESFREFESLTYLLVTGETVKPALVRRWFEKYPAVPVVNAYGPTEASDDITHYFMDKPLEMERVPIGRPLRNFRIYIVDENMRLCPLGVKGEICVSGIGVGRGYLNNPELTNSIFQITNKEDNEIKQTFLRGSRGELAAFLQKEPPGRRRQIIYKTGDIGRWLPDGNIEFFGRKDYQVKIRGYRIELGEIESKFAEHPEVKEAVVIDREEKDGSTYLCAYLVMETDGMLKVSEINEYLLKRLPDYMIPAYFIQLDEMPLTPNGKIERKMLPEPERDSRTIPYISERALKELAAALENQGVSGYNEFRKNNDLPAAAKAGKTFRCFIIGETTLPIRCGEILLKYGHKLLGVISEDPQVTAWAKVNRIAVIPARKSDIVSFLKTQPFDYLFSANNLVILPEEIIALADKCVFNYHNALLPVYAGSYAPYWAVMNREKTHGITWHVMDADIDTGDIVKQIPIDIDKEDTGVSLNTRCYNAGVQAFEELIEEIKNGSVKPLKQNVNERTYIGKYDRPASGCVLSFTWDTARIDAFIRGLNFGNYDNPLGTPRIVLGKDFFIIPEISILDSDSQQLPGTVIRINSETFTVSTAAKDIEIRKILSINGEDIAVPAFIERYGLHVHEGYRFPDLDSRRAARIDDVIAATCKHENFWVKRLGGLQPLRLITTPSGDPDAGGRGEIKEELKTLKTVTFEWEPRMHPGDLLLIAFAAYLSHLTGIFSFDIGYTDPSLQHQVNGLEGLFARQVPLHVETDASQTFDGFCSTMHKELKRLRKRLTYTRDILHRYPRLKSQEEVVFPICLTIVNHLEEVEPSSDAKQLNLVVPEEGTGFMVQYNTSRIEEVHMGTFLRDFLLFLQQVIASPGSRLAEQVPAHLEYRGSIHHPVKIEKFQIETGEIENCLLQHDDIRDAVVVVKENNMNKKYLCVCIVSGRALIESEIKEYLSERLPGYRVPMYFIQMEKIPVTPDGKVDRKLLEMIDLKIDMEKEHLRPRDEVEEKLAEIWAGVLEIKKDSIGINSNFFGLGGHSLSAAILTTRMHKEFNIKITLADIFKSPTLMELSGYVKSLTEEQYTSIQPVEKKEYYELSSAQKRLYILQQLDLNSIAYNLPQVMSLEGKLEKNKWEGMLKKMIRRHEGFRTSFHMVGEEPVQVIHENVDAAMEFYSGEVEEIIPDFIRPFNLLEAPLLRVGVKEGNPGTGHILLVDMHHIISDGVSHPLLIQDFTDLYEGQGLEPLRLQYKDFSEWQNSDIQKEATKQQKAYWIKQFDGDIPVLNLPVDYVRPGVQSFAGSTVRFEIGQEEAEALNNLAIKENTTLYAVILSIFHVLLSNVSTQEDIVIGTPAAGRRHADLEKIIGMFVNTLALRNPLESDEGFTGFLQRVKENTLKSFENQDYPFEELVEEISVVRDVSRSPVFDVMFSFLNINVPEVNIPGLKLTPYDYKNRISKFDLTLWAWESEQHLSFIFEYCTRIFKPETIDRFIFFFKQVVFSILNDPGRKISEIEILSGEEKKRILFDFNNTEAEYPGDKTLHGLFEEQVKRTPDSIAVVGAHELHEGQKGRKSSIYITYSRLNQKSDQLAHALKEKGVRPDSIVGIMIERCVEMVIGIFGILKAGGAYLPIDPNYPQDRIDYMLKDSNAAFLLTGPELLDIWKGTACVLSAPTISPATRNLHLSLAYIIYTSGSTGRPKGVVVEHRPVINRLNWMQRGYPIGAGDVILQKTPFTFDVSVWELFWWSFRGASLRLLAPGGEKNPEAMVKAIAEGHVTTMHFVPSMLNVFLEYLESLEDLKGLSTLRQVFSSGEALSVHQVKTFNRLLNERNGAKLINLYGPTEATVDVSYFNFPVGEEVDKIPIGKPIDNIHLYIVNKDLRPQPIGAAGELCAAGAGLARGYLNRPGLTADRFLESKFTGGERIYRTGDLAVWLPDGNIEFLGRLDSQVKIRGFRIELGEIEIRLLNHGEITGAVVSARKDDVGETYLCGCVAARREFSSAELREYLSRELPDYMIPSYFIQVEKIPLTPNGKIDQKALESYNTYLDSGAEYAAPESDTEELIANIWKEVLHKDNVGVYDNFFDVGGHSLSIIRLNGRLKEIFQKDIPIVMMFRYTTIRSLARYLDDEKTGEYISDEKIDGSLGIMEEAAKFFIGD